MRREGAQVKAIIVYEKSWDRNELSLRCIIYHCLQFSLSSLVRYWLLDLWSRTSRIRHPDSTFWISLPICWIEEAQVLIRHQLSIWSLYNTPKYKDLRVVSFGSDRSWDNGCCWIWRRIVIIKTQFALLTVCLPILNSIDRSRVPWGDCNQFPVVPGSRSCRSRVLRVVCLLCKILPGEPRSLTYWGIDVPCWICLC